MKKYAIAGVLMLMMITTFAAAQVSTRAVVADVPFAFIVGGKTLPAGAYRFVPGANLTQMSVIGAKGKEAVMAPVVTRLSPRSPEEAAVVFDVAGSVHYLAEIYLPGIDGFQVPCAPGDHTHVVVKAKK